MLCNLAASEKVKVFIKPLKKSTTVTAEGKWGGGRGGGDVEYGLAPTEN